jgi:hypothetical protein
MPSCWHEAVSALWIGVLGRYRLSNADRALEAEEQLGRVLGQLERREEALLASRARLGEEALSLRERDRARCKNKMQEYRRTTSQLDRLVSYRDMVMAQMDALRNTELNKTLISALQESSSTLRTLGIVDGVKQAEAVVSDVEQSMAQAQELTSVLGAPVAMPDDELEAELRELLGEGVAARERAAGRAAEAAPHPTAAPCPVNHISQPPMPAIEEEEACV